MKTKLLIRLRNQGRKSIDIISVMKTDGVVTGMTYSYSDNIYKGIFEIGDDEHSMKEKAARICIKNWLRLNK